MWSSKWRVDAMCFWFRELNPIGIGSSVKKQSSCVFFCVQMSFECQGLNEGFAISEGSLECKGLNERYDMSDVFVFGSRIQ